MARIVEAVTGSATDRATDGGVVYKGFRILPARTAGRYRIEDERGVPVVPLSLRIYASQEAAVQAIRIHLRDARGDEFRGPETRAFAGRPPEPAPPPIPEKKPADPASASGGRRLPQIAMNLGS